MKNSYKPLSAVKKFIIVGTASVLCSSFLALPSVSATPGSDFTTAYSATTGTLLTESLWMGVVNKLGTLVDQLASIRFTSGELKAPTSSTTCDGSIAGAIRYESGSAQICNGTEWTAMGGATTDTTPNAFSFTDQTLVDKNAEISSNPVTVSGFDGPLTAYCTNCTVQKGAGAFASSVDGFMPGDTITIKVTSSSSAGVAVIATVALGNTIANWSLTTAEYDGGTVTTVGGYRYHTFKNSGTFTNANNVNAEYIVVGGGGGGGATTTHESPGGGGGAGGFRYGTATLTPGSYSVVVGAGGGSGVSTISTNGGLSSFNNLVSAGGGAGAFYNGAVAVGSSGGSGGGNSAYNANSPYGLGNVPAVSPSQGNRGGGGNGNTAGGGGGAGGVGGDSVGSGAGGIGGAGTGAYATWASATNTGDNGYYAGGGAGGGLSGVTPGGLGGGGASNAYSAGGSAMPNTGGGGGGVRTAAWSGQGGAGIVIIRFAQ